MTIAHTHTHTGAKPAPFNHRPNAKRPPKCQQTRESETYNIHSYINALTLNSINILALALKMYVWVWCLCIWWWFSHTAIPPSARYIHIHMHKMMTYTNYTRTTFVYVHICFHIGEHTEFMIFFTQIAADGLCVAIAIAAAERLTRS